MNGGLSSALPVRIYSTEQHVGIAAALYKCVLNWPSQHVLTRMHRSGCEQSSSFSVLNRVYMYVDIFPKHVSL